MSEESQTSTEPGTTESLITSQTTEPPTTAEATPPIQDGDGQVTEGTGADYVPLTATDLTIPEGVEVDEQGMTGFLDLVNEHQLPREAVDKLVELQADVMHRAAESLSEAYDNMLASWRDEAKSQFGADLNPMLAQVHSMIKEEAGDEAEVVFQALDATGAGNHPALIGFLAKIAKQYAEGTPTQGSPGNMSEQSLAERMFPNQGKGN